MEWTSSFTLYSWQSSIYNLRLDIKKLASTKFLSVPLDQSLEVFFAKTVKLAKGGVGHPSKLWNASKLILSLILTELILCLFLIPQVWWVLWEIYAKWYKEGKQADTKPGFKWTYVVFVSHSHGGNDGRYMQNLACFIKALCMLMVQWLILVYRAK